MGVFVTIIKLLFGLLLFGILMGIPSILCMKYFERQLIWRECIRIFGWAYLVTAGFLVFSWGAIYSLGFKSTTSGVISVIWLCLLGYVITKSAQRYGINKRGDRKSVV